MNSCFTAGMEDIEAAIAKMEEATVLPSRTVTTSSQ